MLHDLMAGPDRDDERWPSADRAKLSFGGQPFAYPQAVELVRPWPLRMAYDAARNSARGRAVLEAASQWLRGARGGTGSGRVGAPARPCAASQLHGSLP